MDPRANWKVTFGFPSYLVQSLLTQPRSGPIAGRIHAEEAALLGYLQTITFVLDRRARSRKAKGQW
jgi:hypothetical protein